MATFLLSQTDIFARLRSIGGVMSEIEELQKEVKRLKIKINALVDHLQVKSLGPPDGRKPYDETVNRLLDKEGLQE
jgi:hypothetical protein